jgi:hypothetical protein
VRNIIPLGSRVFGAVSLSTTLIQGVAGIDEKYLAASLISSFVIALGRVGLSWIGRRSRAAAKNPEEFQQFFLALAGSKPGVPSPTRQRMALWTGLVPICTQGGSRVCRMGAKSSRL